MASIGMLDWLRTMLLPFTSLYLLVKHDPRVSKTAREVKFSEAIISNPRICNDQENETNVDHSIQSSLLVVVFPCESIRTFRDPIVPMVPRGN